MMNEGNNSKIMGMKEYHTKNRVHFEVELNEQYYNRMGNDQAQYEKAFKLVSSISMRNMVGFNRFKRLFRYPTVQAILEEFYQIRLSFYEKRKDYLISKLQRDMEILENKERFIIQVVEEKIVLRNVKKAKIMDILKAKGFRKFSEFTKIKSTKLHNQKKEQAGEEQE